MILKRFLLLAAVLLSMLDAAAQIPYYAATVGDARLYCYSSVKARPGMNAQETYTTFQYGIGDHFATGIDLYTGKDCAYWGALLRYGLCASKWLNVGAEVTPSFNLNDSFHFTYLTSALYLNGALNATGDLFWCTNTWWGVNKSSSYTLSNYEYLGYTFHLKDGKSLSPLVGTIHSWRFDKDVDLAAGCYYSFGKWNLYLWDNDLLNDHPRLVIGLDYVH